MKIVPNRVIIILVVFLLQGTTVFADQGPPPPQSTPPPPPGLPLDGGIVVLALISLCLGIYKLNKIKNTKKASN